MDHGKADGMFINTAGLGQVVAKSPIGPESVKPGDAVILSGDIGRHGIAVMAAREQLHFETVIESDCAPLAQPVLALIERGIDIHCLRDLTRGGLASALVEIAEAGGAAITVDERSIPVREDVAAACELLGLDPLHVANEGRLIAFVSPEDTNQALSILREHDVTAEARLIGQVGTGQAGQVSCRGILGVSRVIDMLSGEQLPRIC